MGLWISLLLIVLILVLIILIMWKQTRKGRACTIFLFTLIHALSPSLIQQTGGRPNDTEMKRP